MKEVHLLPQAKAEFDAHPIYYGWHAFTLSTAEVFRSEINAALKEIMARPLAYRVVDRNRQIAVSAQRRSFASRSFILIGAKKTG